MSPLAKGDDRGYSSRMKLIVGLGNPGKKYAHTRHNAGYLALDAFAKKLDLSWSADAKRMAQSTKGAIDRTSIFLAKPETFMNLSGDSVAAIVSLYKVKPKDILIVHDDMDVLPETMTFKFGGGHAGHKGLASVIERLGMKDFARLRVGIGHPRPERAQRIGGSAEQSTENWVLGKITKETMMAVARAPEAIADWTIHGLAEAMNRWN